MCPAMRFISYRDCMHKWPEERQSSQNVGLWSWSVWIKYLCSQWYPNLELLVGDQLDEQFFYTVLLFQTSTCFEQRGAHQQEFNCINTASGIVTLCKWPSGMQVEKELLDLHTGRPLTESDYTRCINKLISWGWAHVCSKHVEDWDKRII